MYIETTSPNGSVTFRYQNDPDYSSQIVDFTNLKQDLVVTVTYADGAWSADHTYEEITTAISNGVLVRLTDSTNNRYGIIAGKTSSTYWLVADDADYQYTYTVTSDDAWTMEQSLDQGLPTGGTAGQVLTKNSGTDYDAAWENAPVTSVNGGTGDVTGLEETANKVTSISSSSTDTQYPSAKLLYDQLALKQGTLSFDATPTNGSGNPVTSDGIYDALALKQDVSNLVTSIDSDSTDTQYPSAKCVYDAIEAEDVDQLHFAVDGTLSRSYSCTEGVDIDGTSLSSPYCFPMQIGEGEKFKVTLTSSVVTYIGIYAIKSDGTSSSLGGLASYSNATAPFDMVALGVYIPGGNVTGTGTYTVTVEKKALWVTQQEVSDIYNSVADGFYNFNSNAFVVGGLYNGAVVSDTLNICTPDIQTAPFDMVLYAASGYRFRVSYFSGTTYTSRSSWITTSLKIDKGTEYRVEVTTTDGSIAADTVSFARRLSYEIVNFKQNTIELKVLGEYSQDYPSTAGTGIDGSKLAYPHSMRIRIAQNEFFDISLTGSITSGMAFYALKADGTAQQIYENSTYGHYIAPYDMEGIGVYMADSSVSTTGTYTMTVTSISLADIQTALYGAGAVPYWGKKIPSLSPFNNEHRCAEEVLISENNTSDGNDNRWAAGLVVYGDRIFSFNHGDYCMVFDKTSLTLLEKSTLPWSAHNNNAQPTPYFYDANDTFPLFLVSRGDYAGQGEQKFYFVRVVESGGSFTFTIVKTVSYSGFTGESYNCSWFANYAKNELYCYAYPNGDWSVTTDNPIIFHKFAMVDMSDYSAVTLTGADIIETITMQDHWVTQAALYHDDKIYLQASRSLNATGMTINGEAYDGSHGVCFLFIIDPASGYVETVVPLYNYLEQEGMCICDNALYMSEKYSTAAAGELCFRIMKYTFD